jgi:hypothetical protein
VSVSNKNKIFCQTGPNWHSCCIVSISGTQSSLVVNDNFAYMRWSLKFSYC